MSQFFVNFVDGAPYQHGAGHFQTKRVSYVITSNDYTNGGAQVPVVFDKAFGDANYTVQVTLELPTANDLVTSYNPTFINQKTASGFTLGLALNKSDVGSGGGDTLILHIVAFHD